MDVFEHHATALKWAAAELAEQLEKKPSAEDFRTGLAWSPDRGRDGLYRSRWRNDDGALTRGVFNAYTNLQATCSSCHAKYRTDWR